MSIRKLFALMFHNMRSFSKGKGYKSITFDDFLLGEGISVLDSEAIKALCDDEISKLPKNFKMPMARSKHKAINDVEVFVRVGFQGAYSASSKAVLQKGTDVVVKTDSDEVSSLISIKPLLYEELESYFVPQKYFHDEKYGGYSLELKITDFSSNIEPIE